jgi:hypothetical protein
MGSLAQENENGNDKEGDEKEEKMDRWFFGGSLWAQFGTVTQIEIAPVAGYHISPRFDAGIGARYVYYRTRSELLQDFSSHIYGGSVFTRYVVVKNLDKLLPVKLQGRFITHVEYEGLNMPSQMDIYHKREDNRFWAHNYLIGGGLQQQIGKGAYLNLLILYNLNEKSYSLYDNPIIRIGINF